MSLPMPSDENTPVFVTGLFAEAIRNPHDAKMLEIFDQSFAALEGHNMIAFYDEPWVLDYFRHQCFEYDLQLIAHKIAVDEMPANAYIQAFMKRFRSYAVFQTATDASCDPLDKAWNLYWRQYLLRGERGFEKWLVAKLSKIELTAILATEISTFNSEYYCWVDMDFSKWITTPEEMFHLHQPIRAGALQYFTGAYSYLGRELPLASHCLGADLFAWQRIVAVYREQIERLGHFPYAYDEEVVLSLAMSQHPEEFVHYGEENLAAEEKQIRSLQA